MRSWCEPARWVLPDEASASGCFETMRIYQGRIFRLDAHLDRLDGSIAYLGMRPALGRAPSGARHFAGKEGTGSVGRAALRRRLLAAVARSGLREAIVRIALVPDAHRSAARPAARGTSPARRGPARSAAPVIVVQSIAMPTAEAYRRGIRVAIVPMRRFPVSQIDPQAKFSARLGSVLAVAEAQLRGADEAIFLDGSSGIVTESTASNLGIIKNGALLASPCEFGLLAGVTWQAVMELAPRAGLAARAEPLTRHDCYNADEAFVLSSIKEVLPVTVIDGRRVGDGRPGPSTRRLLRAFRQLVRNELRLV